MRTKSEIAQAVYEEVLVALIHKNKQFQKLGIRIAFCKYHASLQ